MIDNSKGCSYTDCKATFYKILKVHYKYDRSGSIGALFFLHLNCLRQSFRDDFHIFVNWYPGKQDIFPPSIRDEITSYLLLVIQTFKTTDQEVLADHATAYLNHLGPDKVFNALIAELFHLNLDG